jgi:phosphatidylinositol alpha 1,6-mannosyltransferase
MRVACVNQDPGIHPEFRKGSSVHVACVRNTLARLGASVVTIDSPGDGEVLAALEAAHRSAPLHLVYERYSLDAFNASRFARKAKVPHVLEVNEPLGDETAVYRGLATAVDRRRERKVFQDATRVVVVSTLLVEYCVARGAAPERIVVRPNSVDPDVFVPRDADDPVRLQYVPKGRFAIGYHGRLRPWHNIGLVVDATSDLLARGIDAHLVLLGEGAFLNHVEDRIPPERCSFVPWKPQEEAARIVAGFDTQPLTFSAQAPCYFSPLRLIESMSAGVVPVVPALGDLASEVKDGKSGLVYPADDRGALVAALERLARDPELRGRLARGAREHALTRTWAAYAAEILDLAAAGVGAKKGKTTKTRKK